VELADQFEVKVLNVLLKREPHVLKFLCYQASD
jgi:hypothetical protein